MKVSSLSLNNNNNNNNNNTKFSPRPHSIYVPTGSCDVFSPKSNTNSNKKETIQFTTLDDLFEDDSIGTSPHIHNNLLEKPFVPSTPVVCSNGLNNANRLSGGKRCHVTYETDFPPMHKSTSHQQFPTTPNKKLQTNGNTSGRNSLSSNNLHSTSSTFQPKFLSEEYKNSCYITTSLRLDDILREIDYNFIELNNSESFQRCHYDYNNVEFSYHLFVMKSTHHCQLKIRIYQLKMNDSRFNSATNSNDDCSPSSRKYLIDLIHEDGDKSLFYHVFHLIKVRVY
jgi:hypothetical protein